MSKSDMRCSFAATQSNAVCLAGCIVLMAILHPRCSGAERDVCASMIMIRPFLKQVASNRGCHFAPQARHWCVRHARDCRDRARGNDAVCTMEGHDDEQYPTR